MRRLVLNGEVVLAGDAAPEYRAHLEEPLLFAADGGDAALAAGVNGHRLQVAVGGGQRRRHGRKLEDRVGDGRGNHLGGLRGCLGVAGALDWSEAEELVGATDAGLLSDGGVGDAVGAHCEVSFWGCLDCLDYFVRECLFLRERGEDSVSLV